VSTPELHDTELRNKERVMTRLGHTEELPHKATQSKMAGWSQRNPITVGRNSLARTS
jgi:hypothetical protein